MSKPLNPSQKRNQNSWQAHRLEGKVRNAGNRLVLKPKVRRSKNP